MLIDGEPIDPPPGVVVMLHKPVGYVCTTRMPTASSTSCFRRGFATGRQSWRPSGGSTAIPRGSCCSPTTASSTTASRRRGRTCPRCTRPSSRAICAATRSRSLERHDGARGRAERRSSRRRSRCWARARARLTLTEGRYHQARRMFAAVGNHVSALHRVAIGGLNLGDAPRRRMARARCRRRRAAVRYFVAVSTLKRRPSTQRGDVSKTLIDRALVRAASGWRRETIVRRARSTPTLRE